MPPRSNGAAGITLSLDRSTCIESRVAFAPRPPENLPSATTAVKENTFVFDSVEAFRGFPVLSERASGDFSR